MRVPLPEFAGSAYPLEVVELEPDFEDDLPAAAVTIGARTRGAVAFAWAASTPTPTSAAIVMTKTEKVAPRPELRLPGRC